MIKLTQYSKAAGCGCKIAPAVLEEILKEAEKPFYASLLVGNETKDDAAVYKIDNNMCVVSTTDFFMPIVDDAFDFGRIASSNAISDIYAMGAKPIMAIAILGWPIDKIPIEYAKTVLDGSREICKEAKIPLAGGHSIDSAEPIFGLAVTGIVDEKNLRKNNTPKEGDWIYLTKPIGTGILSTALKRGLLKEEDYLPLISQMCKLNNIGEVLGTIPEVSAITDVTGFGLVGHLLEMVEDTGFSAMLDFNNVPRFEGINFYTEQFVFPDNTTRNFNAYKEKVKGMDGLEFLLLCDPQTSGGLLFTVANEAKDKIETLLKLNNLYNKPIGRIINSTQSNKIILSTSL